LPETAHARGYEATHVNYYGLHQSKDWDILRVVAQEDWILVTNNAIEFRSRYQRLQVHPGVIFLLPTVPRAQQIELFSAALDVIEHSLDMVNTALDVGYFEDQVQVTRYRCHESHEGRCGPTCNTVQWSTATMASLVSSAMWNLQLAGLPKRWKVRIPPSPPDIKSAAVGS
jgi:predicted nuclease of predicted toxin-antitoxin system